MKMLLDFLNVKTWNHEELRKILVENEIFFKGGLLTKYRPEGVPASRKVVLWFDAPWGKIEDFNIIVDGEDECLLFYKHLEELQESWAGGIRNTIERGVDSVTVGLALERANVIYRQLEGNPWKIYPNIKPNSKACLEDHLQLSYAQPFLQGNGDQFKKVRVCRKIECGKWFIYNRPKQQFCSDKCRLSFHNTKYIKSGKAAAYMRKGREEGKYQ